MDVEMKFVTAVVIGFCFFASGALAAPPEGNWLSEDGGTKVHISTCGANKLCGTLVWLGHPTDPNTGKPKTDKLNPDPAKRARPLIGLQVARAGAERPEYLVRTDLQCGRRAHLQGAP